MTSTVWFLFFIAYIVLNVSATINIDPNIIEDLFYTNKSSTTFSSKGLVQAAAVTPKDTTVSEVDNSDLNYFQPAEADYDKFDLTLTKRVSSASDENFLLSPLGLKLALAILYEAATGPTKSEIASVLGFDLDLNEVRKKFAAIIESLKKESPEYILNLGSRIYLGKSAAPTQRFAATAEDFYRTELKNVDFLNPEVAASEINAWVSNITHGRIPTLVNPDDMVGMVVMILNTLYFKGTWYYQFEPNATKLSTFYVSPKLQKTVDFMNVKQYFYYAESAKLNAKILRMPYRSNKYAMYIIVPNALMGLPHVLNNLSDLRAEMSHLKEHYVHVTLPKFSFEYTSQLNAALKELGVRRAFEPTASFPGIARGHLVYEPLRISQVMQRCGMEVNELGSIAYSATQIGIVNKFGEDTDINYEIVANKPFLFFIQDEETKQLLFTGRMSDPSVIGGSLKTH